MRILFISLNSLSGHQPWARRSLNIIQALSEAGNSVTVLAPQSALELHHAGVSLTPLCHPRLRAFHCCTFLDAFVKAVIALLRGRYDAVHFAGGAVCLYALLVTICRAPVVYDVWRSADEKRRGDRGMNALRKRIEKSVLRRIDAITCSCPLLAEELVLQGESLRICLVENAVSATAVEVLDQGEMSVVVYEHPGRDIESIAQALRIASKLRERVPEARFVICTDLNPHARKLSELLQRLELQNCCCVQGFGGTAEQASLLAGASALLLPESQGGYVDERIIRFMQSGTPIVATRIRAYKQFLDSTRAVLCVVGVDDLAEGLSRVLREPLFSAALAREARAYAIAHFTRSSFNRKVRAVYNELRG